MAEVTRISHRRSRRYGVYFSRFELNQLLSLYSRHVASGEWRDYAIDHRASEAVFSVFRHAAEGPVFSISKAPATGRAAVTFLVTSGRQRLKQGDDLREVLSIFDQRLRLISAH